MIPSTGKLKRLGGEGDVASLRSLDGEGAGENALTSFSSLPSPACASHWLNSTGSQGARKPIGVGQPEQGGEGEDWVS